LAKNIQNNFKKFIKLASAVKKVADKDSDVLDYIISTTEKKTGSNWNIIQRWTSANLFPTFKEKPLSELTEKNIRNAISGETKTAKDGCASVFKVVSGDIGLMEVWDIEQVLMGFEPNLKVQVKLGEFDTKLTRVKNLPLGQGELTAQIRGFFETSTPLEGMVSAERMLIKGRKNNFSNCNYYIQFFFEGTQTQDEIDRRVVRKISLTDDENESRLSRKKDAENSRKRKAKQIDVKRKLRKTEIPKKTISTTTDEDFPTPSKEDESDKWKAIKFKEFNLARKELKEEFKEGIWTKEEFKKQVAILTSKLEKGGVI